MKQYSYEEFLAFVEEQLHEHPENVIICTPRNTPSNRTLRFIKLQEDLCYEPYWRGGPLVFRKGDYIHAVKEDAYGLSASAFNRCYVPVH